MKLRFPALLAALALAAIAALGALPARAGIVSVDTTQARIPISAIAPSSVTVTWRVVRLGGSAATNPGTISSPSGTLLINGVPVQTVSQTLSRFAPGVPPSTNELLTYTETFTIPQAIAFRAVKAGVPIVYQRTFTDTAGTFGGNPASLAGTTQITPTGPGSQPLNVTRLELRFDDGSRVKVLPKGSRLRAVAEVNASGVGLLEGEWQVATSPTTAGTPVFRTLALVRQPVGGSGRTVLTSPPLPTRFEGNAFVRLVITDPDTFFEEPELQFYVTPESPLPEKQEPRLLLVNTPEPGTPLTLTTRFAWQAVPGARLYKLELFGAPPPPGDVVAGNAATAPVPLDPLPDGAQIEERRALTGMVVPAAVTELRLQGHTLAHLPGDRHYQWTVTALGDNGALLAVSPPREIYKP
ncbi:MAG: hypothetical protein Kow00114_32110 [Kiloniellaceae bacterium]